MLVLDIYRVPSVEAHMLVSVSSLLSSFFFVPSCSQILQSSNFLSVQDAVRYKQDSQDVPLQILGNPDLFYALSFSCRKKTNFFWHWFVPASGRVLLAGWNCFLYPFQCSWSCTLSSTRVMETFNWTLELSKRYFHLWMIVKIMFLWRDKGWNRLFYHFADVTF